MSSLNTADNSNIGKDQNVGWKAGLKALREGGEVPDSLDTALDGYSSDNAEPKGKPPEQQKTLQEMMDEEAAKANQEAASEDGEETQEETDQELEAGSEDSEEGEGQEKELPEVETIKANGKDLTIDWNDREGIKQALSRSVMYREEKRAKDTALNHLNEEKQAHESTRKDMDEISGTLTEIQKAKDLGPEAVIKLLFNQDFDDLMEEWQDRAEWSDEKKAAFQAEQRAKRLEADMKAMQQKAEEERERAEQERAQAQAERVQTHFDSSYLKFNFDDSLGDADLEEDLNDRLFEKVKTKFDGKDADEVSFSEIEEAFKSERARLLKVYAKSSKKRTVDNLEQEKQKAISTAQRSVASRSPKVSARKKAKETASKPGGWRNLLANRELLNQID